MQTEYTEEQLQTLTAAIASGVRTVVYADKTVTYHSFADMIKLREQIRNELGLGKSKRKYASFNKGLNS